MWREANLWKDAIYRRFPVKVACSPSCAANSPGLVRVIFWLCRQVFDSVVRNFVSWFGSRLSGVIKGQSRTVTVYYKVAQKLREQVKVPYIGARSEVPGVRVYWSGKPKVKGKVAHWKFPTLDYYYYISD